MTDADRIKQQIFEKAFLDKNAKCYFVLQQFRNNETCDLNYCYQERFEIDVGQLQLKFRCSHIHLESYMKNLLDILFVFAYQAHKYSFRFNKGSANVKSYKEYLEYEKLLNL